MQITSIKASKTPNQVWLTFSDHSFIPFFIDDVVKLSLIKNQDIDDSKFQLIIKTALQFKGREFALRQIAISPKTEKNINQKLNLYFRKMILKYKLNLNNLNLKEISQEIIDYLKSKKFFNQADFVRYFVKKNSKKSHQQIIYMLQQLGIDQTSLLSIKFNQESDLNKIKTLLDKKNLDKSKLSDYNEKNKLKSSLFRRGFNISDINTAIDDWLNFR
ncbi:MAG: RecX family transcriptional regulator [Candidatus Shapirobacteria bacterium]|nr:RecX family transcriptional regulator [Candidatus Shapirobacteria bacterium]MDD4410670.1 RecX family transcriptional regulator [Candidatus Shapirobacteria bacterium]